MNILEILVKLRDDLKTWVTNNLNALNSKIEEKTIPVDDELSSTSTNPVQNKVISAELDSLGSLVGDTPVATQISTAIASQEHFSGDYNDLTNAPDISEDGEGNMTIADESGNIIFKVDEAGTHTTALALNGKDVQSSIDSKAAQSDLDSIGGEVTTLQELVGDTAVSTQISQAIANQDLFSGDYNDLINAPDIVEDGEGNVIVADESGNIIFQVDETGINTTAIKISNQNILDIMDSKVADLVDSSPDTLNTLNELAAALGDDPNFATTVAEQIGGKVDKVDGMGLSEASFTAAEKAKLSNIENGANKTVVESELSATSENPVQSKVIYEKLNELTGMEAVSEQISNAINAIEHPVTSVNGQSGEVVLQYEDIENAPNITGDESGDLIIADPEGNIIFRLDGNGFETTQITATSLTLGGVDVGMNLSENALSIEQLESLVGGTSVADQISNAVAQTTQVQIITWEADD